MIAKLRAVWNDVVAFLNSDALLFSAVVAFLCLCGGLAILLCAIDLMFARSLCLHGVAAFC